MFQNKYIIYTFLALVWGILMVRLISFAALYEAPTYVSDQWGFLNPILNGESLWASMTYQHGSHFTGLGNLFSYMNVHFLGGHPKFEGYMVILLTGITAALLLGLKAKLFSALHYLDGIVLLVVLNLHQTEVFMWLAHSSVVALPLLLCTLAAHAVLVKQKKLRFGLLTVLFTLALFTGYGFILAGLISLYTTRILVVKGHKWTALVSLFIQGCLYLVFVYAFQLPKNTAATQAGAPDILEFLLYLRNLFVNFFGMLEARKLSYAYLLMALGIPLLLAVSKKPLKKKQELTTLYLLFGFSLIYMLLNTYSRAGLGLQTAASPRYSSFLIPGFIAFYFWLYYRLQPLKPLGKYIGLSIFVLGYGYTELRDYPRLQNAVIDRSIDISSWDNCYRTSFDAKACTQTIGYNPLPPKTEKYQVAIDTFYQRKIN